jgi:plastocyanin
MIVALMILAVHGGYGDHGNTHHGGTGSTEVHGTTTLEFRVFPWTPCLRGVCSRDLRDPRAVGIAAAVTGTIRGRVDVRVATVSTDRRPDIGGLGIAPAHDPPDRRRSVAYLDPAPRAAFDTREEPRARMDQRNETFVPHVLAIVAGSWVDFPNNDRTYHNVFSLSKAKSFDLGRYAAGHSRPVQFDEPGIVRVFCDIHSHMSAFILVFAHRYFAVTDDEGRYRLDNVPPGTYTLVVWNETVRGDPPKRTVTMPEGGGNIDADFTIR